MALNSWKNRGKVDKFVKAQANPEAARKALEQFYENTPAMNGVRVNSEFTVIESLVFNVAKTSDILWVYHYCNQVNLYGAIPTGRTHAIKMRTRDGQEYSAVVPTKAAAENLLKFLYERMPGAVFGYNQQLVELWKTSANEQHAIFDILALNQHASAFC